MTMTVTLKFGKRKLSFIERVLRKKDIQPLPGNANCTFYLACLKDGKWIDTKYYGNNDGITVNDGDGSRTYDIIGLNPQKYQYLVVVDNPGVLVEVKIRVGSDSVKIKNPSSQVIGKVDGKVLSEVQFPGINKEFPKTVYEFLRSNSFTT